MNRILGALMGGGMVWSRVGGQACVSLIQKRPLVTGMAQ